MPATPKIAEGVVASCSFCGKPNTEVKTIVAGPGVFICDECVDLSVTVVAASANVSPEESARLRAQAQDRPAHEILGMLPALARGAARRGPRPSWRAGSDVCVTEEPTGRRSLRCWAPVPTTPGGASILNRRPGEDRCPRPPRLAP